VTVAALIAGMSVEGNALELLGLFGLGVLVNFVAALWGCGVAMFLRTEQAGSLIQMPVFVILFLAPVYVPLKLLSGWIHAVARYNPATVALEAARGLIAGSPVKLLLAFVLLLVGSALMAVWARRGLASAERAG
jgi:ABC-2 type transport system permease protein